MLACASIRKQYQHSYKVLFNFLRVRYTFTYKTAKVFELVSFMQKRFRCRLSTHEAKLDILISIWQRLLGKLYFQNLAVKDKKVKVMIQYIVQVKEEIRMAALLKYLRGCKALNDIAFIQWRHRFPNELTKSEENLKELEDMLQISMERTYHQFEKHKSLTF